MSLGDHWFISSVGIYLPSNNFVKLWWNDWKIRENAYLPLLEHSMQQIYIHNHNKAEYAKTESQSWV